MGTSCKRKIHTTRWVTNSIDDKGWKQRAPSLLFQFLLAMGARQSYQNCYLFCEARILILPVCIQGREHESMEEPIKNIQHLRALFLFPIKNQMPNYNWNLNINGVFWIFFEKFFLGLPCSECRFYFKEVIGKNIKYKRLYTIYLLIFIHILKKYQEAESKQFTQIQSIRAWHVVS